MPKKPRLFQKPTKKACCLNNGEMQFNILSDRKKNRQFLKFIKGRHNNQAAELILQERFGEAQVKAVKAAVKKMAPKLNNSAVLLDVNRILSERIY